MKLTKNDYIVIRKKLIEKDLKTTQVSLKVGYLYKKGLGDVLCLAKKGKGTISLEKALKLEEELGIKLEGTANGI